MMMDELFLFSITLSEAAYSVESQQLIDAILDDFVQRTMNVLRASNEDQEKDIHKRSISSFAPDS